MSGRTGPLVTVAFALLLGAAVVPSAHADGFQITLDSVHLYVDKTIASVSEDIECWAWCQYTVDAPEGEEEELVAGGEGTYYVKEIYSWDWNGGSATPIDPDHHYKVNYSSAGQYTIQVTCNVEVRRVGTEALLAAAGPKSKSASVTVMKVEIDTPASFPAYVVKGETLSLGCSVTPAGATGGTFSWSKASGPGNVTFSPSASSEDPTFSADTAGTYTVKVQYTKGGSTAEDTSGDIVVLDTGWVEFDCTMTANSASSVVTATGGGTIWNARWNDGTPKTKVYFDYNPDVTTSIRVRAAQATSANNGVSLDGDKVRPNGDNYDFSVP